MGNSSSHKHSSDQKSDKRLRKSQSEFLPADSLPPSKRTEPVTTEFRKSSSATRIVKRASSLQRIEKDKVGGRRKASSVDCGPISPAEKSLICSCWENSKHGDLGNRIYLRVFDKRKDFHHMFDGEGRQIWMDEARSFTEFLQKLVPSMDDLEAFERLSRDFGAHHADLKGYGFKPDFWVTLSDAMTTECLYLDMGMHQPAEVISAWGSLISLMLTGMRDGYYDRLRLARRSSKKYSSASSGPPQTPQRVSFEGRVGDSIEEETSSTPEFYDAPSSPLRSPVPAPAIGTLVSLSAKTGRLGTCQKAIEPPATRVVNAHILRIPAGHKFSWENNES